MMDATPSPLSQGATSPERPAVTATPVDAVHEPVPAQLSRVWVRYNLAWSKRSDDGGPERLQQARLDLLLMLAQDGSELDDSLWAQLATDAQQLLDLPVNDSKAATGQCAPSPCTLESQEPAQK